MSMRLDSLLRAVADAQDDVRARTGPARRAQTRSALLQHAQAPTRRRWPVLAVPVAAIVVVVALVMLRPSAALTFEHGPERRSGVVGAWLAAPAHRAERLRFSDGSEIDLRPGTRARVTRLESAEASVVLEAGSADVHIEPGHWRGWQIDGGPYRVEVTGTRFALAWDPASESFDLELHEGSVVVTGPGIDGAVRVAAGESLHVGGERVQAELGAAAPVPDGNVPAPSRSPDEATRVVAAEPTTTLPADDGAGADEGSAPAARRGRTRRTEEVSSPPDPVDSQAAWRELAAAGSYRDALAAAEAYGFAALCESVSARDLLQLADVGRFARKPQRAIEALRAVRRRFPDTDTAAMAAFERGRIAITAPAAYPEAAKWFATYLRERPDGPLVREALARLMEAQRGAGQHAAARKTAERYLDRFPGGPHRDLAAALLSDAGPSPP